MLSMPPGDVKFDAGTAHFGEPFCSGHPGYDARTMADTLDLPELLTEVIAEVQAEAEARGVHVTASHLATMPRWVEADEAGLRRRLHNALDFVVGAAAEGTVLVHLDAEDVDRDRWTCVMEWQDVRCSFGLTLPLARDRATERPLQILIVDDSPQQRAMVAGYLAGSPHGITEAAGGTEAISLVKAAPVDVVLLDWQMPGMDGAATCRAIRAQEADGGPRRTFIVALAGMGDAAEEATGAGADGCLPKPVSRTALLSLLGSVPEATGPPAPAPTTWSGLPPPQLLAVARHQLSMILVASPGTQMERLRLFGHHLKTAATDAHLSDIAYLAGGLEDAAESGVATTAMTAARTLQAWMARAEASQEV
jgi:CheY-like chemotaxis protein